MIFCQTTGGDFSYLKISMLLLLLIETYNINKDEIRKMLSSGKKVEIESLCHADNNNLLDYLRSKDQ